MCINPKLPFGKNISHFILKSLLFSLYLVTAYFCICLNFFFPVTEAVKSSSETNAVITTAVMADLPVLATMLSNLFESSSNLRKLLIHFIQKVFIDRLTDLFYSNFNFSAQ